MVIPVLYIDNDLVIVNKPHGLLMHRSSLAKDAYTFLLQELRNQLGRHVYIVHRLDRKTAGIVILALHKKTQSLLSEYFRERKIHKQYIALVRGYTPSTLTIDYPLKTEGGNYQEAITHIETINNYEINLPFGKHDSSRYSLIKISPETGRMHQIRKHMAHVFHPIIGDRPHGCNKQNKLWKERWDMHTMLLHASYIQFSHPSTGKILSVSAPNWSEFKRSISLLEKYPR